MLTRDKNNHNNCINTAGCETETNSKYVTHKIRITKSIILRGMILVNVQLTTRYITP